MFSGTLLAVTNKKINVTKSLPSHYLYSRARSEIKKRFFVSLVYVGGKSEQGDPLDMGNENKSNSKQVNYLLEAPIKDKVKLEDCKMRLLCIYSVLDFILGWPLAWTEQTRKQ